MSYVKCDNISVTLLISITDRLQNKKANVFLFKTRNQAYPSTSSFCCLVKICFSFLRYALVFLIKKALFTFFIFV